MGFYILCSYFFMCPFLAAMGDNPWDPRTGLMAEDQAKEPEEETKECDEEEDTPQCQCHSHDE